MNTIQPSCLECQRRKQKCSRNFPCNHCSKRGVSHLCQFPGAKPPWAKSESSVSTEQTNVAKKRVLQEASEGIAYPDIDFFDFDASNALSLLGYSPGNIWMGVPENTPKNTKDVKKEWEARLGEEMREALREMPPKPYTDCLVDNWLSGANHHYYALYQPEFRAQYDGWWANRQAREDISPAVTSLVLRVCASSSQFLPLDNIVRTRLENDLNEDVQAFSRRLHQAARKLNKSIPPGQGGLVQVQQMFLTAYWWKSEEEWVEAWHALGEAINIAREIGLHDDSMSDGMSEFDREMRRRLWALLYMWDYAMSSLLARPLLINSSNCNFVLPTLSLENDPRTPGFPSPFFHINIQCQLFLNISVVMENVTTKTVPLGVTVAVKDEVELWFSNLPPVYRLSDPETKWDKDNPWIVFQRRYLHMIGLMTIFHPLKPYLTRDSSLPMSDEHRQLRDSGVTAALQLMDVAEKFYENLYPTAPRFHYAVFCIFDTSTVLCSGMVHDLGRNLPRREMLFGVVKRGLEMLEELHALSGTTTALCDLLKNLILQLRFSDPEVAIAKRVKRGGPNSSIMSRSKAPSTKHASIDGESRESPAARNTSTNGDMDSTMSGAITSMQGRASPAAESVAKVDSSSGKSKTQHSFVTHRMGVTQMNGNRHVSTVSQAPKAPTQLAVLPEQIGISHSDASETPSNAIGSVITNTVDAHFSTMDGSSLLESLTGRLDIGPASSPVQDFWESGSCLDDPHGTHGLLFQDLDAYNVSSGRPFNAGQQRTSSPGLNDWAGGFAINSLDGHPWGSLRGSSDTTALLASSDPSIPYQTYETNNRAYSEAIEGGQEMCGIPEPQANVDIFGGDLNLDQVSYRAFMPVWDWGVLRMGHYPYSGSEPSK